MEIGDRTGEGRKGGRKERKDERAHASKEVHNLGTLQNQRLFFLLRRVTAWRGSATWQKISCRLMTPLNSLRYLVSRRSTDRTKSRNSHATDAAVTIRLVTHCLNSSASSTAAAKAIFIFFFPFFRTSLFAVLMYDV